MKLRALFHSLPSSPTDPCHPSVITDLSLMCYDHLLRLLLLRLRLRVESSVCCLGKSARDDAYRRVLMNKSHHLVYPRKDNPMTSMVGCLFVVTDMEESGFGGHGHPVPREVLQSRSLLAATMVNR